MNIFYTPALLAVDFNFSSYNKKVSSQAEKKEPKKSQDKFAAASESHPALQTPISPIKKDETEKREIEEKITSVNYQYSTGQDRESVQTNKEPDQKTESNKGSGYTAENAVASPLASRSVEVQAIQRPERPPVIQRIQTAPNPNRAMQKAPENPNNSIPRAPARPGK